MHDKAGLMRIRRTSLGAQNSKFIHQFCISYFHAFCWPALPNNFFCSSSLQGNCAQFILVELFGTFEAQFEYYF